MDLRIITPEGREYSPLPTQARFHSSGARHRTYIGGFGGGKTLCGAVEAILQSLEYPGRNGKGVVARYEYKGLMGTTWKTLLDTLPKPVIKDVIASPPKGPKIVLKTGFEIEGWNLKAHGDFASLNLAWFWLDECNQEGIDQTVYNGLRGRLRDPLGSRQSWLTGNPAGMNWVYDLFFAWEDDPSKKRYPDHAGFRAREGENVYLPADYYDDLRSIYGDEWVRKYLQGDFSVFEGQILNNFAYALHVIAPFRIPGEWPRFRGLDHGLDHPSACVWAATDYENNLVVYRNYHQRNSIPAENARNILSLSVGEEIDWTMIDPSTLQRQTAGDTIERIIDQYRRAGLVCQEGVNSVRDSIALLQSLLQPDPNHPFPRWHPRRGELGSPKLFFTSDCSELIWEIQQWRWRDVRPGEKPGEKPVTLHDDCIAALRYLVMRSPRPAQETIKANDYERFLQISEELMGRPPGDGADLASIIGNEKCYLSR